MAVMLIGEDRLFGYHASPSSQASQLDGLHKPKMVMQWARQMVTPYEQALNRRIRAILNRPCRVTRPQLFP